MITTLRHTRYLTRRELHTLLRQPWYIGFTLAQPVTYLVLFGALFKKVAEIPGFGGAGSYLTFLTPGIVVMTALFTAGWTGMGVIDDIDAGVMDRFLTTPVRRSALVTGRLVQLAIVTLIQTGIVLGLGALLGARFPGGVPGVSVLVLAGLLLCLPVGALSQGTALVLRQRESVIGAFNFVLLPLTFVSSLFMAQALMPGWMQTVARFNPVNWAVSAGRIALSASPDWGLVGAHLAYLAVFGVGCGLLATRAFRTYQRAA